MFPTACNVANMQTKTTWTLTPTPTNPQANSSAWRTLLIIAQVTLGVLLVPVFFFAPPDMLTALAAVSVALSAAYLALRS